MFTSLMGNAISLVAFGTSKNLGTAICVRLTMVSFFLSFFGCDNVDGIDCRDCLMACLFYWGSGDEDTD